MFDISGFKTTDPLSDLAIRMANERTDYIASDVFLPHFINKAQYKWYQYDKANLRRVVTKKSSNAEAEKVEFNVFNSSGQALLHKLAGEINPEHERDADAIVSDIETKVASQITEHLLTDLEVEAVALATTSTNYPSALATSLTDGTSTWLDAGGDPIGVIKTGKVAVRAQCAKIPMDLAAAWEVVEALRVHPSLIQRIQYTGTALPDTLIASLLGISTLHVAKALRNTATEGAADALSTIWDDDAVLFYKDNSKGNEVMTYGRMFMVEDLYTYRYEEQRRGAKNRVKVVEMGWEYDLKHVARVSSSDSDTVAGYLITNAI